MALSQLEIEIMAARKRACEMTIALTICSDRQRLPYLTEALKATEEHIRKLLAMQEPDNA